MLQRIAYKRLLNWKSNPNRKPLIVRGARQVGKTTLIREFGKEFRVYIELNLEKKADVSFFERLDSVNDLVQAFALDRRKELVPNDTLIFIDEIQESPKAIQLLRFFKEERPDLLVICAGSLLEFALKEISSFPVGRVGYLMLHPLNFDEYLMAVNPEALELLDQIPIPEYAHTILLKYFHEYALMGGMPEVVSHYVRTGDLSGIQRINRELWNTYLDDVEKYASNRTERQIISHVINSAPFEHDRIKFEGFGHSAYRSREVGESLRALDLTRLIQLIYPATGTELPILPDIRKRPRLQFVDTGLLVGVLNLQADMIGVEDLNSFHKGRIIQHLVYQQIISIHDDPRYRPAFWVRGKKGSSSEVDLVLPLNGSACPVEIKSGSSGRLRSLHQYIDRSNQQFGIRLLANTPSVEQVRTTTGKPFTLINLPYYLATRLEQWVQAIRAGTPDSG